MRQYSSKEEFLKAFDAYSDAIFRFCVVKTSDADFAEDLVQETFMRYWNALEKGKSMTNTKSFLFTIANNLVIDWYRKKKSVSLDTKMDSGFEVSDQRDTRSIEISAEHREVLEVLQDMEEGDREVLLLRYVEGLSPKEIASLFEETANVVSVRINRATERLRQKLHAYE